MFFSNDGVDSNGNEYFKVSWQWWLLPTVTVCCAFLVWLDYQSWQMGSGNRRKSLVEKGLNPTRRRLAAGKQSFEEHIVAMSATVRRLWQNVVEYGNKHYLSATYCELINWEPRVPEGKTRVRWKCVSLSL